MSASRTVHAAGTVVWRVNDRRKLEVLLVHRPRYDDWSWPKGKLEVGEDWAAAAARETLEETGMQVRLGVPLPRSSYPLVNGQTKHVRYWAGEVIGGDGALEHEVDEVAWLSPARAMRRLSHDRDREQLEALVSHHDAGLLATWPLLVVRHAHSVPRGSWGRPDPERPLSDAGRRRVRHMVQILDAYAPRRVLSSPAVRCVDSVEPYTRAHSLALVTRKGLSEEGFEASPHKVGRHLEKVLHAGEPVALCTHGPVLAPIVQALWQRADDDHAGSRRLLAQLVDVPLDKGEILACMMSGAGGDARVVAVERHRP